MRKLALALACFVFTGAIAAVAAEDYPTRPLHLVVGYPAGVAPDIVARLIAQPLSERLGQPVIVDNRPGAASNIGTETVVRASPDGYTLLVATFANAVNATLYHDLNFDFVRDITPIVGTFSGPTVMVVTPSLPVKTVPEFITYAKANPGKINYVSSGHGTVPNVAGELFNTTAGVHLVHVPYRGSFLPDLLSGQTQLTFVPLATVLGYIKSGKLRALAVTGATRSPALPDVPTLAEFLPGFEVSVWHGIGAPKGTPPAILDKLNREVNAVLADPKIKERFADLGGTALGGAAAEFGKLIASETEKWGQVIRAANITPE
jgi:tripartite-type tricarboxylate transporter receptor subunit TctC